MNRICLDTSAYSQFRRGAAEADRVIRSAREVFVPTVVLGELRVGFLLGRRSAANEAGLQAFLADPIVTVLNVDDQASALYAQIVVELRRAGTPLPSNDIWIAALAAREAATVVTFDSHFASIGRVGSLVLGP